MLLTSCALYSHPRRVTAALARARRLRREEHGGVPAGGTRCANLLSLLQGRCGVHVRRVHILMLSPRRHEHRLAARVGHRFYPHSGGHAHFAGLHLLQETDGHVMRERPAGGSQPLLRLHVGSGFRVHLSFDRWHRQQARCEEGERHVQCAMPKEALRHTGELRRNTCWHRPADSEAARCTQRAAFCCLLRGLRAALLRALLLASHHT